MVFKDFWEDFGRVLAAQIELKIEIWIDFKMFVEHFLRTKMLILIGEDWVRFGLNSFR